MRRRSVVIRLRRARRRSFVGRRRREKGNIGVLRRGQGELALRQFVPPIGSSGGREALSWTGGDVGGLEFIGVASRAVVAS